MYFVVVRQCAELSKLFFANSTLKWLFSTYSHCNCTTQGSRHMRHKFQIHIAVQFGKDGFKKCSFVFFFIPWVGIAMGFGCDGGSAGGNGGSSGKRGLIKPSSSIQSKRLACRISWWKTIPVPTCIVPELDPRYFGTYTRFFPSILCSTPSPLYGLCAPLRYMVFIRVLNGNAVHLFTCNFEFDQLKHLTAIFQQSRL